MTVAAAWLLESGSPSVQYRVIKELLCAEDAAGSRLPMLPYASRIGLKLLLAAREDGTWPGGLLGSGPAIGAVGAIPAYRRLLELGWDPDLPVLGTTRRLLFRLLAEDSDPAFLFDQAVPGEDDDLVKRGRLLLREGAAAALAQAGFEGDPRLRGAARRLLDRVSAFLKSPTALKPWVRIGNQHVLPAEAAPPSYHLLVMLAFMPHFRSEHHEAMDRLYHYLSQPWPRQQPVQQVGGHLVEQPHLVLGDPLGTRNVMDADVPAALGWLELMARVGFLKRNEGWQRLLDRLLDDRDRKGVWRPPRAVVMPEQVAPWCWPLLPLTDPEESADAVSVDVTFRLALVARLAGRTLDFV